MYVIVTFIYSIRFWIVKCLFLIVISYYINEKYPNRFFCFSSLFRQNCSCHQLIRTAIPHDGDDGGRCSLSESRHSIGSAKTQHRRSSEYHRAHHPRVLTPTISAPRHSNYRTPTSAYARASKRMVQHQNSQASLLYGYQHHL